MKEPHRRDNHLYHVYFSLHKCMLIVNQTVLEDIMVSDASTLLLHIVSSTAVPVSLIISSQVVAQSGESMSSQILQENPVSITFTVEGVGCIDIQISA